MDLQEKKFQQNDLFNPIDTHQEQRTEKLMHFFETVNKRYGRHTIKLASEGNTKPWCMKRQLKSPNYTTNWQDLLQIS